MRVVSRLFTRAMHQARLNAKKDFAARWHSLAEARGLRFEFATVVSETSRLAHGESRGFSFFFLGGRIDITAAALECPVEWLLSELGIIPAPRGTSHGEQ
jgi:hypothetical protein